MTTGAAQRSLVTGATGFVGSHLVRALVADGGEVHIVARTNSGLTALDDVEGRITVHRPEGSTEGLIAAMRAASPDIVFHLASLFIAEHRSADVAPLVASNVLFPAQLLEAMAVTGVRRLVNTGTAWQHFRDSPGEPSCLYAATKTAFEALLEYYRAAHGLHAVTLKLFDTYGPRDRRPKLFALLAKSARSMEPLAMSGGAQRLDLVYIDDVVDAFREAAARLARTGDGIHETFAVTSGRGHTLREVVAEYERIKRVRLNIQWGARPYRAREVMEPWSRGEALPGWRTAVPLAEGIARLPDP